MLFSSVSSILSSTSPRPKTSAFAGPNFSFIVKSVKYDLSNFSVTSLSTLYKFNLLSSINAVVNVACTTFSKTSLYVNSCAVKKSSSTSKSAL